MTAHPPAVELTDADELAHPPGDERLWGESWYFDFTDRDGTLGGYVRLGLYPNLGVAWYWACLVGEGRPLVTVIDHEVALPKAPSLEIRADGLWADHIVETPVRPHDARVRGLRRSSVDDPAEVYGDLRGDRVPFGFDLEWETDRGGLYPWIGTTRYEVSCNVHGEILVGDETIEFDGIGQRDHSWGVRDWWNLGWVWTAGGLEDGTRFHTARIRVPGMDGFAPGYVLPPGGGVRADRRVHGQRGRSASTASPPAARSPAVRSSWPWSRATSARCTSSTRRPTAPATPGSRARCAASRPPTAAPASAGRSGTSRD